MKKIFSLIFLLFAVNFYGQVKNDSVPKPQYEFSKEQITLLASYNFWANSYAEIGIGKNTYGVNPKLPPLAWGPFLSCEVRPGNDGTIIAPKVGYWLSGGIAMGANALYYTNFSEGSLRLRPEFGIGLYWFKFMYGYNIPITNSDMKGVNSHNISISLFLRLGGDKF